MKTNIYYIFRHGETFASKSHVPYGKAEYTTTILPEGIPAIERVGEYLKNIETTKNYTSEILRCQQTKNIVSEITGKKFEDYPLLNEMINENFSQFKSRMQKLVSTLEENSDEVYLLCTHGAVVSALKYLLTNKEYNIENLKDYPRPGTILIIENGKDKLLDFNR